MFNLNLKKNRSNKTNKGFTIVESLVAIFILLMAITGPMYFTQGALRVSFVSRDQVTAFFLAQDAIEYIKNVRDNNAIKNLSGISTEWINGLNICFGTGGCSIDTSNKDIVSYNDSVPLKVDSNGFFGHIGTTPSIFYRKITIEGIDSSDPEREIGVTVEIKWKTHETIGVRSIIVKENIFNWATSL